MNELYIWITFIAEYYDETGNFNDLEAFLYTLEGKNKFGIPYQISKNMSSGRGLSWSCIWYFVSICQQLVKLVAFQVAFMNLKETKLVTI